MLLPKTGTFSRSNCHCSRHYQRQHFPRLHLRLTSSFLVPTIGSSLPLTKRTQPLPPDLFLPIPPCNPLHVPKKHRSLPLLNLTTRISCHVFRSKWLYSTLTFQSKELEVVSVRVQNSYVRIRLTLLKSLSEQHPQDLFAWMPIISCNLMT